MSGRVLGAFGALVAAALVGGCGLSPSSGGGATFEVVAMENFWGSIASQLAGDHAHVTSIIVNPDTDPHDYEAKPEDARLIARARYVTVNGAGYDPWAQKLLDANPVQDRTVLTVGDLFGKKDGDNPHLWYSPASVDNVVDRIAADMEKVDPGDASYFEQQKTQYKANSLREYHNTIGAIRQKYSGVKVGATESIFQYLAEGVGLNLVTPYSYLKAINDGTDPSPADKAAVERQITNKEIKVLVVDTQNTTPDVQALAKKAQTSGIPLVNITETLVPADATFQAWQTGQLKALLQALGG